MALSRLEKQLKPRPGLEQEADAEPHRAAAAVVLSGVLEGADGEAVERILDQRIGNSEVPVVEHIEGFHAEFEALVLRELQVLEERDVREVERLAEERITADIAVRRPEKLDRVESFQRYTEVKQAEVVVDQSRLLKGLRGADDCPGRTRLARVEDDELTGRHVEAEYRSGGCAAVSDSALGRVGVAVERANHSDAPGVECGLEPGIDLAENGYGSVRASRAHADDAVELVATEELADHATLLREERQVVKEARHEVVLLVERRVPALALGDVERVLRVRDRRAAAERREDLRDVIEGLAERVVQVQGYRVADARVEAGLETVVGRRRAVDARAHVAESRVQTSVAERARAAREVVRRRRSRLARKRGDGNSVRELGRVAREELARASKEPQVGVAVDGLELAHDARANVTDLDDCPAVDLLLDAEVKRHRVG